MRHSGFRRWGVVAVALLGVGCGYLPETGGQRPEDPPKDFFGGPVGHATPELLARYQYRADRGYNGTIADLGSSIDPRTPESAGTPGRSRLTDVTGYMGRPELDPRARPAQMPLQGIGGSGQGGEAGGTSDQGWRARRGNLLAPPERGNYGGEQQ